MIPAHTHSGVLPPFLPGASPSDMGAMAPYQVSFLEIAHRFGTTNERIDILRGLLQYRQELRSIGIVDGFQWIDGSFVEDCEKNRGRAPNDVDIITFSARPASCSDNKEWKKLINAHPELFDAQISKNKFKCDAYFVDIAVPPLYLVNQTKYWFGLFSHQRDTFLWKGMLEIPLLADDKDVQSFLAQGGSYATQT